MLPTTTEYDIAVRATARKWHARVEITWTDPFIDSTIVAAANDKNRIHSLSNCLNHVADSQLIMPYRYAHLDSTIKADGTFHPFPGTDAQALINKVGWWGAIPCDANGHFGNTGPGNRVLTLTFATRPIDYLLVCGDNIYGEYPVTFDVKIYTLSTDVVPVYTDSVIDSVGVGWTLEKVTDLDITAVKWVKPITPVTSVQKMELVVKRWNIGNRVVKISEFYRSIITTYTDDDIISMQLTEEKEVRDGTLPTGNIASAELDLKLQNIDDLFFWGNTASKYHDLLKKNRRIRAWIGLELPPGTTEWILLGKFWSGDWVAEELGTTAETSARNRMELLRKSYFDVSLIYTNTTLYDLTEIVLSDAKTKFPDLEYYISPALGSFALAYAWFDRISYFDCLKKIAAACQGYCYVSREDVLTIGLVE